MPLRRTRSLLAAALVLALLAGGAAAWRLRVSADIAAMLPEGSPAAAAYRELLASFGTFEKVVVLLRLPAGRALPASHDPVTDGAYLLEELLEASPDVADVRLGIDDADERFFLDHVLLRAPLFLPAEALPDLVEEAIREEALVARARELARRIQLPGGEFLAPLLVRDPLGFLEELPGLQASGWGLEVDVLTGMFRTAGGDAALLIVTPRGEELDADLGRRLLAALELARQRLRDEIDPDLELLAVGGPLYAAEDETLIRRDLEVTVSGSVVVCALLLVVAFGGWRVPLVTVATILVALLWAAGAIALSLGDLAALSLGFAAVLIGLGVDYCIHGATRLAEASQAGASRESALEHALSSTGPAIVASALTSAGAFGVLMASALRPLAELGALVAIGMLMMLLATYLVGAPLALLLTRPHRGYGWLWRGTGLAVAAVVRRAEARPRVTLLVAALLLAAVAGPGLGRLRFDNDLRSIRPADHGMLVAEEAIGEAFEVGLDTATVLVEGASVDEAFVAARRTAAALRFGLGPGASVESPSDWRLGPAEKAARLAALERLSLGPAADRLELELFRAGLQPRAFAPGLRALRELGEGRDPAPPAEQDLPAFVQESVHVRGDGRAVLAIHVRLAAPAVASGADDLGEVLAREGLPARVASTRAVAAELGRLAVVEARRLGLVAGIVVVAVVWLTFRGRWAPTLLSLVPVSLGAAFTLGAWGLAGGALDLVSIAVLPILFGIGVDNGLHVLHGASGQDATGRLGRSANAAGRAMVLTTLTTAAGFASLMLSSIPGLRRGGLLVSLGMVACLLATLTLLPALGALRSRERRNPGSS